jgi:multidrug efflux system outer membrane protein
MARRALFPLLLLAGCNLAPPHQRPDLPTAASYPEPEAPPPAPGAVPAREPISGAIQAQESISGAVPARGVGYADFFPDARLRALIELGLARNRDLAAATARIAEAGGLARIQRADLYPGIDASGSVIRNRSAASDAGGQSATRTRYAAGLVVPAFELDFWGRVRNLNSAARSTYLASIEGERAARLALIRSIAAAYYLAREADERVALAEATVVSRQEGLRIARLRLDAGVTSALDFRQSESLLTQAETELAQLKLARAEARNLVFLLIGGPAPEDLPPALPLGQQKPLKPLAAGLPSDLMTARPDVIAAEERLKAARANVGAARAAFFPSISLTGGLGYASADLASLFDSDGLNWSFGPSISIPLFDWGRRRGNVDVAVAREDIAIADYERTIQQAFREVSDGLAGRQFLAEEVAAQARATEAQREIARLARIRYREGVANYLEVLDAERNLFTAEQALISLRRQELDNLAALYAALGGGLPPPQ